MSRLSDYRVRWLYRENGELQTKVVLYENQSSSLSTMVQECRRIAKENGWRLWDVVRLKDKS